jgi:PBSX family phage terminase large subunit
MEAEKMINFEKFGAKSMEFLNTPVADDARINILEGSVRSSKTVTMLAKWLDYILNGPPGLLLMTGVTKETLYDNVLYDLFETVGSSHYKYNHNSGELLIYGRRIKIIGAKDEGSEKYLRGKTLAGAYCDEVSLMPKSFYLQLLNRLSIANAKLYGTTNPDTPYHYLYTEYITNDKLLDAGIIKVWHFILEDNPSLSQEYIEFIKKAYSGLWFKRNILGLWVMAEGIIFDQFNEDTMRIDDDTEIPEMMRYWIGCDYGTSNATTFMLCAMGADHKAYVLDEYYHSGRDSLQKSPAQYSKDLKKFIDGLRSKHGIHIRPERIYIDPSAESFIVQLYEDGLKGVTQADNAVKNGIELMSNLMGSGNFRVHKKCKHLLMELSSYIWDSKAQKIGEDKPVKENDHCIDSVRYCIYSTRQIWSRYI